MAESSLINQVFREAWLKAISPSNVCGGFRKSGVFPFNRDAVIVLSADENEGDSDSHGDGNSDRMIAIPPSLLPPLLLSFSLHGYTDMYKHF